MKLIHLTDTHITDKGVAIFGREAIDTLKLAIADINKHHSDADCCIITGDLTHWGDEPSFLRLKSVLETLNLPCHLVIGNHDHRELAASIFPEHFPRDDNGFLQQVIDLPEGKLFLLDSVKHGTHEGEFCPQRQTWLAEQLAQYPDDNIYLAIHHAPFKTGLKAMDTIGINAEDAAAMASILATHNHVKHLFFGHYHRPISGQWQGIPFSCLRSMMLQVTLDLISPDEVIGKHEQPQYGVVLIDDGQTVVHYHDFADTGEIHSMGGADT